MLRSYAYCISMLLLGPVYNCAYIKAWLSFMRMVGLIPKQCIFFPFNKQVAQRLIKVKEKNTFFPANFTEVKEIRNSYGLGYTLTSERGQTSQKSM